MDTILNDSQPNRQIGPLFQYEFECPDCTCLIQFRERSKAD